MSITRLGTAVEGEGLAVELAAGVEAGAAAAAEGGVESTGAGNPAVAPGPGRRRGSMVRVYRSRAVAALTVGRLMIGAEVAPRDVGIATAARGSAAEPPVAAEKPAAGRAGSTGRVEDAATVVTGLERSRAVAGMATWSPGPAEASHAGTAIAVRSAPEVLSWGKGTAEDVAERAAGAVAAGGGCVGTVVLAGVAVGRGTGLAPRSGFARAGP